MTDTAGDPIGTGIYSHPENGSFTIVRTLANGDKAYDIKCESGTMFSPVANYTGNAGIYLDAVERQLTIIEPWLIKHNDVGYIINSDTSNVIRRVHILGGSMVTRYGRTIINIPSTAHGRTKVESVYAFAGDGTAADLLNVPNGEVVLDSPSLTADVSRGTYTAPFETASTIGMLGGQAGRVTGHAATGWTELAGARTFFPAEQIPNDKIRAAYFQVDWWPNTTSGQVRLYNRTDAVAVVEISPGATGHRFDRVDITSTVKGWGVNKQLSVEDGGDGTTAPEFASADIQLIFSEEEP